MRCLLYLILVCCIMIPIVKAAKGLDNDCIIDSDCTDTYEHCDLKDLECKHNDVFPLEILEFFGSVILGIMIALSNAGGIGGGGIIVPIGIVFFSFRTKQAVALSNFCIFTASVVRFIINYNQKHPNKDAKVIDYGVIMVMFPMVLLGSLIGVQLNLILPEIILLSGLTVILGFLSIKSIFTSLKIYKKEKEVNQNKIKSEINENSIRKNIKSEEDKSERLDEEDNEGGDSESNEAERNNTNQGILPSINVFEKLTNSNEDCKSEKHHNDEHVKKTMSVEKSNKSIAMNSMEIENNKNVDPILLKILAKEKTHLKPVTLFLFPFLFIVLILLVLLRGTSSVDSIVGVESCSVVNFLLLALLVIFYFSMTIINIVYVKKEYKLKMQHGYKFVEGDLRWEPKLIIKFVISALCAGFIAGTVGLGGGVIFNPLLLSFKVPPQVASATGMFMIMFGSLSNIFLYIMADYLDISYGFWCGTYTAVGTAIGIKFINDLIKKTGKTSYLAFLLTFVIILSAIIVPIFGTIKTIEDVNDGENLFSFGDFCD